MHPHLSQDKEVGKAWRRKGEEEEIEHSQTKLNDSIPTSPNISSLLHVVRQNVEIQQPLNMDKKVLAMEWSYGVN